MDYKKEIIEMVEEIENIDYLSKIYHYIIVKYRKDLEQRKKREGEN